MNDFVSMSPNVLFTRRVCFKRFLTVRANERPGITVASFMPIECTLSCERAIAFGALEVGRVTAFVRELVRLEYPLRNKIPRKVEKQIHVIIMIHKSLIRAFKLTGRSCCRQKVWPLNEYEYAD